MVGLLVAALAGVAPAGPVLERREPCADRDPLRRAYFGDLHVHTRFSLDASTQGTRVGPREAYRFARGEPIGVQPHGPDGEPLRTLQLSRRLDFAAVTDHAELLGETSVCESPGLPGYDSVVCRVYRRWPRLAFYLMNGRASRDATAADRFAFCGPRSIYCLEAAASVWAEIRAAAEEAYDRTRACEFTTFVGYEWTGSPEGVNLHRNVLFGGDVVPDLPVSYFEAPSPAALWRLLYRRCAKRLPGCEFLAIPHNSNLSGGLMFDPSPDHQMTPAHAAAWAQAEPLIEVMQHKGDSECLPGVGANDEACGFEKLPYQTFAGKYVPWMATEPTGRNFVRAALGEGLVWQQRLGVNPFRFGLIAGTDTHLGTPGAVSERDHPGHGGAGTPAMTSMPPGLVDDVEFNPGGLAVVWAEENSRTAIFESLRRREVYGTSGPRLTVRFFGGWDLSEAMCDGLPFVEHGYQDGVPMGGVLAPAPSASLAPVFAVWTLRDPGTERDPGTPLQRVQMVKGWVEDGQAREHVYDVVGDAASTATVDLETCEPRGDGYDSLCGVWRDPAFDPEQPAFYYVRVLENPSCRWTTHACNAAGVDCAQPATIGEGFEACCDPGHPRTVQERAWSSPIWYVPAPASIASP
jgi:hypothetical protein